MGTKELRWPATALLAARRLVLALGASTIVVALSAGMAQAQDMRKARDKMVELNKQALLSYEAKDYVTARDLLTKALKEAKQAHLEEDKMTARTYLHLGAVYWVGFQDQPVALQNFSLAKKIRPDIQLTPSIETADLKSVFDLATVEAEPEPSPPSPSGRAPGRATTASSSAPELSGDAGGEPDLPSSMPAPLMCTVPPVVPPHKALTMRCALKPGIRAKIVQIHYRTPGVEAYQALGMRRTVKGWYLVTLPSSVMKAGSLQVYFDARDASDNEVASNGQVDSPSIIEVKKPSHGGGGDEEDPMARIRAQAKADKYEAGLRRRREGSIWVGLGAGSGWGFAPAGTLEWETKVKVSAITTTTGMFHLLPEVGYMWSDDFAFAAQIRWEFIQQQQAVYVDPSTKEPQVLASNLSGAPSTMAPAGFLRAIWYTDLLSSGNLRLSWSGDVGGGFVRFPVKPVARVTYSAAEDKNVIDYTKTIAKTDTRPMGMFLLGGSLGILWNISRYFAISVDGRFLTGLPAWGAVIEGALSAQLAFGGSKGSAVSSDEEDEEEEDGLPEILDEPPTSDFDDEEEEE
jgi:hypothetical protein